MEGDAEQKNPEIIEDDKERVRGRGNRNGETE